jgi:hypothetical protein
MPNNTLTNPMLSVENVLVFYPKDGTVRVCGPACYDAKGPVCACICGGLHHAKGFAFARQNADETLKAIAQRSGDPLQYGCGFLKATDIAGDYYCQASV